MCYNFAVKASKPTNFYFGASDKNIKISFLKKEIFRHIYILAFLFLFIYCDQKLFSEIRLEDPRPLSAKLIHQLFNLHLRNKIKE